MAKSLHQLHCISVGHHIVNHSRVYTILRDCWISSNLVWIACMTHYETIGLSSCIWLLDCSHDHALDSSHTTCMIVLRSGRLTSMNTADPYPSHVHGRLTCWSSVCMVELCSTPQLSSRRWLPLETV